MYLVGVKVARNISIETNLKISTTPTPIPTACVKYCYLFLSLPVLTSLQSPFLCWHSKIIN